MTNNNAIKNTIKQVNDVKDYLKSNFLEREEVINGLMLSIIAQENALLIGAPGTAKSNIVMELAKCIDNSEYFQWLLTKYTVPEEVFGALLLKELEQGVYKRNTTNKLPESHFAFIDEIFKASSAILNSLLTIINEKLFYNNGTPVQCPLMSVIGASNEYPDDDELDALDDRFIVRYEVQDITDNNNFISVLNKGIDISKRPTVDLFDFQYLQALAEKVTVPTDILNTIVQIKEELHKDNITASTRRWVKALKLVKASAILRGSSVADHMDLEILKDVLWRKSKDRKNVQSVVKKYCYDPVTQQIIDIQRIATDVYNNAINQTSSEIGVESNKKMKQLLKELELLGNANPSAKNRIDAEIAKIQVQIKEILAKCLGI